MCVTFSSDKLGKSGSLSELNEVKYEVRLTQLGGGGKIRAD
jgi:hypothetical protein